MPRPSPPRVSVEFVAHCAVLGVRTAHTIEELTAAYRPLIQRWHPDRHQGQPTHGVALDRAKAINEAYAFLSNVLERARAAERAAPPVVSRGTAPGSHDGFPDPSVLEIFLNAAPILSVGYNSATGDLFVKYVGHRIYRYRDVPPAAFEALLLAPSVSGYVRDHMDPRYEYQLCKRTT